MTSADARKATSVGGIAIIVWSTLAILTTLSGEIPPFQLVAMALTIAFFVGLLYVRMRGSSLKHLFKQPLGVWILGIWGLFGYHFLYFIAFRLAPPVEVNLLNYLWPLLIVLLSALLLGESLRWWHLVGTVLALLGTFILVAGGESLVIESNYILGYAAAVGAAVVWSTYSVISRKFRHVPTEMVAGYCGVTAVLATLSHLVFENTVTPQGMEWVIVLAIGIGPAGSAFYFWDHGVKKGDIRVLGVGSYIIPLLSTGLLVLFGRAISTWELWLSCALIVAGAVLAGKNLLWGRG
jgi:drug/metabolite transporter (DMT)-like permease